MISLSLTEIASAIDGQLVGQDTNISQIVTDSRTLQSGELFLALKGPNFDGHRFIAKVIEQGCKAVIVEQQQSIDIPQIVVADTHAALGRIGAYVKSKVART